MATEPGSVITATVILDSLGGLSWTLLMVTEKDLLYTIHHPIVRWRKVLGDRFEMVLQQNKT